MCQEGFLKKDEHKGWVMYEDLEAKTIQWKPTPDKSKNCNPTSLKGGLHSIEKSTTMEAKFANIMRRLDALELRSQFR